MEKLDGLAVPVRRSLVDRILLAGLPRNVVILFWSSAGALVLGLRQAWLLPVAIALHLGGVALVKRDPHVFECAHRALKSRHRLVP